MEIDDLIETVDRLKTEKSDLEQEITDLRVSNSAQDLNFASKFDFSMFEETRQSLDDHMDRLAKATEELDAKTRQIEIVLEEKQMAEKQVGQLQNDLVELKHELEQVKENKGKEIIEIQQEMDRMKVEQENLEAEIKSKQAEIQNLNLKVTQVDLEASPNDFFNQFNSQPEENVTPNNDTLGLQQALDAKEEECSSLRSERDTLLNIQGVLQAQIENLNQMQVKNEDFEAQSNTTSLAVPSTQSVEKGLSASSYFDTLGANTNNSAAADTSDSNPFLETSVFETRVQEHQVEDQDQNASVVNTVSFKNLFYRV